jgi:hypothetical protein
MSYFSGALAKKVFTYLDIDSIAMYSSLVIVALASVVLYIIAISEWLPSLLVAKRKVSGRLYDRGIKKYAFPEGRGVVYQPGILSRKYVKKYMLFSYEGNKYIRCMFDGEVKTAFFELVIYDNQNVIIKTEDVFVELTQGFYSQAILLPAQTSHACLTVLEINGSGVKRDADEVKWYRAHMRKRRGLFAALAAFITLVESALVTGIINYFLDFWLEKRYHTTFEQYVGHSGGTLALAVMLIAAAFVVLSGLLMHSKNN